MADGGNPHRWYNPSDVQTVIGEMVKDFQKLDPADSAYFSAQRTQFNTVALAKYHATIAAIKAKYAGTKVGASESIFAMLAPALGLDLITPYSFLKAISEGTDVSAADKQTIDQQIASHEIKIYVYNSQNVTPDVQAQLSEVKAQHIPYATITETLAPATATVSGLADHPAARHPGRVSPRDRSLAEARPEVTTEMGPQASRTPQTSARWSASRSGSRRPVRRVRVEASR